MVSIDRSDLKLVEVVRTDENGDVIKDPKKYKSAGYNLDVKVLEKTSELAGKSLATVSV